MVVHCGNNREVLALELDDTFDAIVTDPPYGLGFMGKAWDHEVPGVEFWRELLRVAKPGAHLLAFGGTRLWHRMAVAIEDAGWEIRDSLMYLYGTGFPKSMDVAYAMHQKAQQAAKYDLRFMLCSYLQTEVYACRQCRQVLLESLSEQEASQHWRKRPEPETTGAEQPGVARWGNLEAYERELHRCSVCTLSHGILADGPERRICDGASPGDDDVSGEAADSGGGCASRRSLPVQQLPEQFDAVSIERRAQALRGHGTALKPAWEPIILARKPLIGTVAANVLEHGTGGLNIDGCRVEGAGPTGLNPYTRSTTPPGYDLGRAKAGRSVTYTDHPLGRFPANLILDEEAGAVLDEQTGDRGGGFGVCGSGRGPAYQLEGQGQVVGYGDSGGPSRFFYCARASVTDREEGLEHLPKSAPGEMVDREPGSAGTDSPRAGAGRRDGVGALRDGGRSTGSRANIHPTVKPTELMRYLCRLITPPGGTILDPFCGSGSTGKAATLEGFGFYGIDMDPKYVEIARARIAWAEANRGQS